MLILIIGVPLNGLLYDFIFLYRGIYCSTFFFRTIFYILNDISSSGVKCILLVGRGVC